MVDFSDSRNVQCQTTIMIEACCGRMLGTSLHPFETTTLFSALNQAKASGAGAIAFATTTTQDDGRVFCRGPRQPDAATNSSAANVVWII